MKREVVPLALRVALAMALLGVIPAQAATKISSCPVTITAPGEYEVTRNLICAGTAITITASEVDLNLDGHTLSGSGGGDGIFVQSAANVSIRNGAVRGFFIGVELQRTVDCRITNVTASQNGDSGIVLDSEARANRVTRNTASGNGFAGIDLEAAFANTVTDNTATQNGDRGINIRNSSGNIVARNTSDRNGSGIDVDNDSHGNTVARNSCTGNGDGGIRILDGPTQNTIQDNTVSGNFKGIWLALGAGAHQNTVQGNTANLNVFGIWLDPVATSNRIQGNTALTNTNVDLVDDSPDCDSNAWSNNRFATDNVAGASDGGPGAGCIK
jgi:parallel beta-helix repeat protein